MPNWKKVIVSGSDATLSSLYVTNSVTASIFSGSFTGSLEGTASWANNAISASYALTASYAANIPETASYALQALSASYASTASYAFAFPDQGYQHTQTISSTTWTVVHNLNTLTPLVDVYDDSYNQLIPAGIQSIDANTTQITFSNGETGYAIISKGSGNVETATSASYATTASYALNSDLLDGLDSSVFVQTGSFNSFTSSQEIINGNVNDDINTLYDTKLNTSSFNDYTSSLATTGSNTFEGNQQVNGWINATDYIITDDVLYTNAIEENLTNGGITFVAGGFGFAFNNNIEVTGSLNVSNGITGSLFGTASWAENAVTSSYASQALSSSYALTASYAENITISGSITDVDYINFDTASSFTNVAGRLGWDSGEGTLQLGLAGGNVQYSVGETLYAYAYNAEPTTLTKGQVVYISGSQGNRVAVKLASDAADPSSAGTLGLVAETITSGGTGWIITEGPLRKLNTLGLTAGKLVFLSSTPGGITQTPPTAPSHSVRLGYVERVSATVGSIFVKVDNGYEIGELHDVVDSTTSGSYGDLFVKNGSVWINSKQLTGSYGLTGSLNATSITGSLFGTASNAVSSSYSLSGSYAVSSSYSLSGSYTVTASYADTATSASYAVTSSYLNPITNGYVVLTQVSESLNYADDAAAAAGGVPLGGVYRNGNFIAIRIV